MTGQFAFDSDVEKVCAFIRSHRGRFPDFWKLQTHDAYRKLFFGIQKRDLSEYMLLFDEGVQTMIDIANDFSARKKLEQEEKEKFTVKQLKEEMKNRKIYDTTGRKADLINRLLE